MKKEETYLRNIEILYTVNDDFKQSIKDFEDYRLERGEYFELTGSEEEADAKFLPDEVKLKEILKRHNLTFNYFKALQYFFYKMEDPGIFFDGYFLVPFVIKRDEEDILVVELSPEVTLKDVQKNWNFISRSMKYFYKNYSIDFPPQSRNAYRDIQIYKLKQLGKTGVEITKIINNKFSKAQISYQEVSKIIQRLKEKAKKITGGKS